jgi:hypothetical protein
MAALFCGGGTVAGSGVEPDTAGAAFPAPVVARTPAPVMAMATAASAAMDVVRMVGFPFRKG